MKLRLTHIISVIMLLVILLPLQSKDISREEIKKKLPKMLGANNVGREFYFSFVPCWETPGASNDLKIYISSGVRTKVIVDVPDKGYQKIKYTVPNDIIEFTLAPAIGQVYSKNCWSPFEPDKVYKGSGIHVKADDPIICYGVTRYQYTSDGFLAIPVPALGKDYIIASFADVASNSGQWLPSMFTVTAAYDKTKVLFTMGGTDWSKTVSGQTPGEQTQWNLSAGDVLMVSSLGTKAELTGSTINASKPVGVISGNFCAYIPTNCGCCDVIEEMELPTNTWGTEYHVTRIINRLKNSIIKIFAKEPKTNIYRDHQLMGFVKNAGGILGTGYLEMRADEGVPRPVVISGDKPISVTQYNCGQSDDGITSDPFQLILTPTEQYQKEIIFNTPGIRGGFGFPQNYLNLCYEATEYGTIPEDLEFATVEGGQFSWQKLMDLSPNPGDPFIKAENGPKYYSKTITLQGDGVYKIRSSKPFAAYAYGFSSWDSYGFPTSVALGDLTIVDTLPPIPEWLMDCMGNVNKDKSRLVTDKPDLPQPRSNLSTIYMHSDISYNYVMYNSDFMPCEDASASWYLETIDPTEDAMAVITFMDCAGNKTDTIIEYNAPDIKLIDKTWDYGRFSVGDYGWHQFHLINSGTGPWECTMVNLKNTDLLNKSQGFDIYDAKNGSKLTFPITIFEKGDSLGRDSLHFWVKFSATMEGSFWDSIGFGDTCFFHYKSYVQANVGQPIIDVSDWNFPPTIVDSKAFGQFDIKNIGTVDLVITGYDGPTTVGAKSASKIYVSTDLEERNISEANPLTLKPTAVVTMNLEFTPDDTISYPDEIRFISNTIKKDPVDPSNEIDSICKLSGSGLLSDLIATSYNWEKKRIDRPTLPRKFPMGPYPALKNTLNPDTCIRLYNGGNTPITIKKLNETNVIGDKSAFIFDRTKIIGASIPAYGELIVEVFFQPQSTGNYLYTFEYETDNAAIKGVQTTLQGIGILPRIQTSNYNLGKTIVNDYNNATTERVVIVNEDWAFGDSVTVSSLTLNNILDDITVQWSNEAEPFRYNRLALTLPTILQPGDTLDFDVEFVSKAKVMANGSFTTVSDAEQDVVSNVTGEGFVPNATTDGTNTTVCFGQTEIVEFTINNTGETNLLVGPLSLSDNQKFEFFDPNDAKGFIITPGNNRIVKVTFLGDDVTAGRYDCQVNCQATPYISDTTLKASWTIALTGNLFGQTVGFTRQTEIIPASNPKPLSIDSFLDKKVMLKTGQSVTLGKVTGLKMEISFNPDFLKIEHNSQGDYKDRDKLGDGVNNGISLGSMFDSYPAGSFAISYINYNERQGLLNLTIERNSGFDGVYLNSPEGGELLAVTLRTFLPKLDSRLSDFKVKITTIDDGRDNICLLIDSSLATILVDETCVYDVRKIVFTGGNFYLSNIKPNPVTGDNAIIEFEVALVDCQTKIEVYNSANQLVAVPIDKVMQPGRYEVNVPVQNWSNGSYYYIMKAGPFEEQRRMVITK